MKKLALLALLLLAGCDAQQSTKGDGYTFEQGSQRIAERSIRVVTYETETALKAAYAEVGQRTLGPNEDLFGFSVITKTGCTIHALDPKVNYRPEELGHELTHCLYGEFHPSQNER